MGKAAIVNPYLDTLGGGERYTLSFAKVLAEKGYQVDIQWKSEKVRKQLENRFGMDLRGINFIPDVKRGDGYDICFWVSDGSIPTLRARKNFLHFQVPFRGVSGKSLLNKMKLFRIDKIVCNSEFTKSFIDAEYGVESIVVYPPVDITAIKPKRKENIILFVGRFSQLLQSKNQDILIKAFKSLFKKGYSDWKLTLAGGVEVGADDFIKKLEKEKEGYPIEIIKSPNFSELKDLYGKARFFWSAVGFGADVSKEPQRVEHFGITLVEAMAAGCVPIVYNAGGYKEIVKDGENGFLWDKTSNLVTKTSDLIRNKKTLNAVSKSARESSSFYGYERFKNEVGKLI